MPVQGLSNGAQPVTGYNYGAGQYSRVRRSIRFQCGGDRGVCRRLLGRGHAVSRHADPGVQQ